MLVVKRCLTDIIITGFEVIREGLGWDKVKHIQNHIECVLIWCMYLIPDTG